MTTGINQERLARRLDTVAKEIGEKGSGQINIKIDCRLHADFNRALKKRGISQRDVLTRAIEAFVHATNSTAVLHMDGSLCPLNSLILDLTQACRQSLGVQPAEGAAVAPEDPRQMRIPET